MKALMKSKITLFAIGLVCTLSLRAQPSMEANSPAYYLMLTTEQQEIYLKRYIHANADLVATCQPNLTLDGSNKYFIKWVNNNPQFLRRNLTSAFTAALLDSCREK